MCLRFSISVMKPHGWEQLEKERVYFVYIFTFQAIIKGTHRNTRPGVGTGTKTTEEWRSLPCSSWLTQPAFSLRAIVLIFFIYFCSYSFPPTLLRSSQSLYPLNFLFFSLTNKTNTPKIKTRTKKQTKNKTKCQTKAKNIQKTLRVHFVLISYSWSWGLSWNMVDILSVISLEKAFFSLFQKVSIVIASWLRVGLCIYLPFSMLGFCLTWICAGLVHAASLSVHIRISSSVDESRCFCDVVYQSLDLQSFPHVSWRIPETGGCGELIKASFKG